MALRKKHVAKCGVACVCAVMCVCTVMCDTKQEPDGTVDTTEVCEQLQRLP